ncbi:hypothetical protein [Clostridium akagii]|uniref:hypothetical protein n=1 Tax=Clostridium akagii TaxID=91623 RepID=UPI00047C9442|nr:hypothetical protein [Clostridium akagii]
MGIMDMIGKTGKGSNLIVWGLILVVVFGFGKGKKFYNFNFNKDGEKNGNEHENVREKERVTTHHGHKRRTSHTSAEKKFENMSKEIPNDNKTGFKKILGNNGIFILVVVALLFLCKDGKKHTSEEAV